jgi:4-diphosphocytidyl-2-C-methyl-D-erythritol kinase
VSRGDQAAALRVAAPAKLNLYLHVVGRRADGYHLLDSLVAFTAIGDELTFTPASDLSLTIDGPFANDLSPDADNLVLRAARAIAIAAGRAPAVAIHLAKRLPVASGIGGGSADAAATLRGLDDLWNLRLSNDRLQAIALQLGADVPVCLAGTPSFFGGIGDELTVAPGLPAAAIVLVNPGTPLPTASVFRARPVGNYSKPARWTAAAPDAVALAGLLSDRANDLTDPAIALVPAIAEVLADLDHQPGCLLARLSGSGATCFGLFADPTSASAAAATIAAARPSWWVVSTSLQTSSARLR